MTQPFQVWVTELPFCKRTELAEDSFNSLTIEDPHHTVISRLDERA
ncbi:hypothetical protein [Candidatus Villigracilis saccharophilus]|nr:hypothetical protein [Anaerolineales bacterium]